jgi:hypothetical protein
VKQSYLSIQKQIASRYRNRRDRDVEGFFYSIITPLCPKEIGWALAMKLNRFSKEMGNHIISY